MADTVLADDAMLDTEPRPGDLGAIAEQHGRLYAAEYGFDQRFEAYVSAGLADAVLGDAVPRTRFWLVRPTGAAGCAAAGSGLLGSAAVCTAAPGVAQFRWFLLDPALRGRGIGARLLDECLAHCRAAGYRRVLLWTVDLLDPAAAMYRRAGFAEAERVGPGAPWGRPLTEIRYELALG